MKNITWLNIFGVSKQEVLEGLGFVIKNDRVTQDGIIYCLDSDGNHIYAEDVLAVVGGKDGKLKLITDISEIKDEEGF